MRNDAWVQAVSVRLLQDIADGWLMEQAGVRQGLSYASTKNVLSRFYLLHEVSTCAQALAVCFRKGLVK